MRFAFLFLASLFVGVAARADDPANLTVDRHAGTLRLRSIFVNPERNLEIFGTHVSGPDHETLVQFFAEGPEIYAALLEIGARPPAFWNATSDDDLRRVLGDRFVIFLQWESAGEVRELPAEKVLVESGTGFLAFVRGFTFGSEKVLIGDPPEKRIPRVVEITIGDPTRQGSVHSLLFHPKDIAAITPWLPPLEMNTEVLGDLRKLVEEQTRCTLILRRVAGEVEILGIARQYEKEARAREFLDTLLPVAREIDMLKKEHVARVERIQAILAAVEHADVPIDVEERKRAELQDELRRGSVTVALIWERYLELYSRQEGFKVAELRQRQQLSAAELERAVNSYEHGLKTELAIARVSLHQTLIEHAYENETQLVKIKRAIFWAERKLKEERARLEELRVEEGDENCYHCQLFEEVVLKRAAETRFLGAQQLLLTSLSQEYRLRVEGSWESKKSEILGGRSRALAGIELANREFDKVQLLSDIRWTRNFLGDGERSEDELLKLEKTLQDFEDRLQDVEREIEARRKSRP